MITEAGASSLTATLKAKVGSCSIVSSTAHSDYFKMVVSIVEGELDRIDMFSRERKEVNYMTETIVVID